MDRRPLIAGNWKMNLNVRDSIRLIEDTLSGMGNPGDVEVLVAPPFTALHAVKQAIGDAPILLGAQNMHPEASGAYTGEVSGPMLQEAGCTHVILGHSERRALFGESSAFVNQKLACSVRLDLVPIVCIGETLGEREAGKTFEVIREQLEGSLRNLIEAKKMSSSTILAYEPVWAIGTGRTATPEQAQEVHAFIRGWLKGCFGPGTSEQVRILYGGSVKPGNVKDLMGRADIDGALVGGASLKADSFVRLVRFEEQ